MDSMKLTELSYIFSLVTSEKDSTVYAIDPESETILDPQMKHWWENKSRR